MSEPPVILVRAVQTSVACPSQWDAWDAEGNYYYLRYRHGHGRVQRLADPDVHLERYEDPETGEERYRLLGVLVDFEHGDDLDGSIDFSKFCELAGVQYSPDVDYKGFNRYLADAMLETLNEMQGQAGSINTETGEVEL